MKLHPPAPDDTRFETTFRHSAAGEAAFVVVFVALCVVGAVVAPRILGDLPGLAWIVVGPTLLILVPLMLLVAASMVGVVLSSRKPTNWLAGLELDGLYLNLRSFRNGHFEQEGAATVVFLEWKEIESVALVRDTWTEETSGKRSSVVTRSLELCLSNVDTSALDAACFAERTREAPTAAPGGARSSVKHRDVPVWVERPGVVRVQWLDGLLEALREHVSVAGERTVDLDAELAQLDPEERVRALARRGERLRAVHVAREELGLAKDEARRWVDAAA